MAAYFAAQNRNKASLTVNYTLPEGQDCCLLRREFHSVLALLRGLFPCEDILRRLLKTSDVLVENFKTGTLEKYGLGAWAKFLFLCAREDVGAWVCVCVDAVVRGYDDLRCSFPSLVYCSITGFGQTGPYSPGPESTATALALLKNRVALGPRPGYDALVQAFFEGGGPVRRCMC